tara:strand:+ start:12513 stop:13076 length:564 start_codon:yes stop_codon:yes gene_type:complete
MKEVSDTGIGNPGNERSKISAGHKKEIQKLYEEHNDSLVRFLCVKLGSRQEAMDIAQEAYVKVLGLDNPDVINHLRAYLFRTARNLAINRIQERNRKGEDQTQDVTRLPLEAPGSDVAKTVEARQKIDFLERVIQELPPKCRLAFVLYKFDALEYREIARRMGLSESMIRKYVLQAVRYCAERLKEY